MREEFRIRLPEIIEGHFSRELTDAEWSDLHLGLGRADLAALDGSMATRTIRQMYTDPNRRMAEITKAEAAVRKLASAGGPVIRPYLDEARELARFMVTGEIAPGNNAFKSNAYAIASLLDPTGSGQDVEAMARALDPLVTLLAIEALPQETKDRLQKLATEDPEGFDAVAAIQIGLAMAENRKLGQAGEVARLNAYKGHIPAERRQGLSLIVANDAQHNSLLAEGYVRLGDYKGSGLESGKRGYYYSTVAGNGTYAQGALQTVHQSAWGIDPVTGLTVGGTTAGAILGRDVARVTATLKAGQARPRGEVLRPVWGVDGKPIAYERHMDPAMLAKLKPNTHMGEMLGAWAGRQVEEREARGFNEVLVEALGKRWEEDRRDGREGEYVNLADPTLTDPVLKDAWSMVPRETRAYAAQVFGEPGMFMVRKDMVPNAVGYRVPSPA